MCNLKPFLKDRVKDILKNSPEPMVAGDILKKYRELYSDKKLTKTALNYVLMNLQSERTVRVLTENKKKFKHYLFENPILILFVECFENGKFNIGKFMSKLDLNKYGEYLEPFSKTIENLLKIGINQKERIEKWKSNSN